MALRIATIVIVVFSIASLRSAFPASADDLVVATYEFMHAANDRPLDVRFVGSVRYTLVSRGPYRYHYRSSDMLTLSEQAEGAKIISRRRYSSDPATRSKKRYDGLLSMFGYANSSNRPNQAMQRTAGRSAFPLLMTSTLNQQQRAPSPAVADLVSR